MTIKFSTTLICDVCGQEQAGIVSTVASAVAETRRYSKKHGWGRRKVSRFYEDLCPVCNDIAREEGS